MGLILLKLMWLAVLSHAPSRPVWCHVFTRWQKYNKRPLGVKGNDSLCSWQCFGWNTRSEPLTPSLYSAIATSLDRAGKSDVVLFNYLSWHHKYWRRPPLLLRHTSIYCPSITHPSFHLRAMTIKPNPSLQHTEGHMSGFTWTLLTFDFHRGWNVDA